MPRRIFASMRSRSASPVRVAGAAADGAAALGLGAGHALRGGGEDGVQGELEREDGAVVIIVVDIVDATLAGARRMGADRAIIVAAAPEAMTVFEEDKGYFV